LIVGVKDLRNKAYRNYLYYTHLERDLNDSARLDDLIPFRKFQRISVLHPAQLLNYSESARDTGISVDTARRYLECFIDTPWQLPLLSNGKRFSTKTTQFEKVAQ